MMGLLNFVDLAALGIARTSSALLSFFAKLAAFTPLPCLFWVFCQSQSARCSLLLVKKICGAIDRKSSQAN